MSNSMLSKNVELYSHICIILCVFSHKMLVIIYIETPEMSQLNKMEYNLPLAACYTFIFLRVATMFPSNFQGLLISGAVLRGSCWLDEWYPHWVPHFLDHQFSSQLPQGRNKSDHICFHVSLRIYDSHPR